MSLQRFTDNKKRDPFRNFNFRIKMQDVEVAACRKISGLTASVEVVKFRAGNSLSSVDELLPGRVMYEPITLESGITTDTAFKDWAAALIRHEGDPKRMTDPDFRREIEIEIRDLDNTPVKRFAVHRAWVSKYTAMSELAADANDVLIETLEIQHEGFTEVKIES